MWNTNDGSGRDWIWFKAGPGAQLYQFDVDGPVRRAFSFLYTPGKGKAEQREAARVALRVARENVVGIKREPKPRKKKLNRAFGKASWFELVGKTYSSEPVHLESWIFRGESKTYIVLVVTYGGRAKSREPVAAILEGLREE